MNDARGGDGDQHGGDILMGGCAEHIRARGGRVSGEQAGWIDVLKKQCYVCAVCHGCEAAVAVI